MDENTLEFKRKTIHLLNGTAIAIAVYLLRPAFGLLILAPLALALAALYFVPRVWPDMRISNHLMYHFERRKDIATFPFKGAIMYGLGITAPIVLLDVEHACAVILVLSVGDAFSNLVGRAYGRHRIGHKSLEGAFGFFLTGFAASSVLLEPWSAATLSFAGMLIELFLPGDDNITIPWILTFLALFIA